MQSTDGRLNALEAFINLMASALGRQEKEFGMLGLVKTDTESARPCSSVRDVTLADQLVGHLASLGITDYFGVPGGAIEPLFNALARSERRGVARVVPMRSEAGAAFAADGYFRATGRLAVCTATTGPGTSNLLTGVMSACADRIPMLVITPQVASGKQGRGALQDSSADGHDLERVLATCCRYSSVVTHPEQLPYKLARALAAASTGPRGPVHLSIPTDVLAERSLRSMLGVVLPRAGCAPLDAVALDAMLDALSQSRCPVFYVGDDAGRGAEGLPFLAQRLGAKVVSSPGGKRWLGHTHACYRGVLGFSGHPAAASAVAAADLIVALGATFDELSTNAWSALPERIPLYSVDEHAEHAYRVPHARPVIASTAQVVDELERLALPLPLPGSAPSRLPPSAVGADSDGRVHPAALMSWLSQRLPPHVVLHVDAGNGFSWSTRHLTRPRGDTYRVAMGAASMGWAIGAVVGAAVATSERTLCVVGDGSMLMSGLELTVAIERGLPITYVVLNDSSLGMVKHGQRLAGAESVAHAIPEVRFDRIARACGVRARRIDTFEQLQRLPTSWLVSNRGGPALIDVQIDPTAVPPMAERVAALAQGVAR